MSPHHARADDILENDEAAEEAGKKLVELLMLEPISKGGWVGVPLYETSQGIYNYRGLARAVLFFPH